MGLLPLLGPREGEVLAYDIHSLNSVTYRKYILTTSFTSFSAGKLFFNIRHLTAMSYNLYASSCSSTYIEYVDIYMYACKYTCL